MNPPAIIIRQCETHEDLQACVDLQRQIWGFDDEDLAPVAIFVVAQHTGGHSLIAFDGARPVGFTLAFSATESEHRYWHSHMAGVLPEYQNRGLGRLLKMRQRQDGLAIGVSRIEWTFDPLEMRNAHFNITRLGGVVRRYIPNCYGTRRGRMDAGLPTDRFVCEWELVAAGQYAGGKCVRIPLPANLSELKRSDPARVRALQQQLREQVTELFSQNYAVTGFVRGPELCEYILERNES